MAPIALQGGSNDSLNHGCSVEPDVTIDGGRPLKSENMDPIAVIGYAFKFPQEATNPDAFWQMLKDKRCAMTEWPEDRLNVDAFYHPDSQRLDTVHGLTSLSVKNAKIPVIRSLSEEVIFLKSH